MQCCANPCLREHQPGIFRCRNCSKFVDCREKPRHRLNNIYGHIKKEDLEKEKGPSGAGNINREIYRPS
jgi:hypothetical protein